MGDDLPDRRQIQVGHFVSSDGKNAPHSELHKRYRKLPIKCSRTRNNWELEKETDLSKTLNIRLSRQNNLQPDGFGREPVTDPKCHV